MKLIVTSYVDPDLDGTACGVGYAELLTKQGREAVVAFFGNLHKETQFVLEQFKIPMPPKAEKLVHKADEVVLVDASDTQGISKEIVLKQVVEIIDHRSVHEADAFPNAQIDIQLVGSCATLIAERFKAGLVTPSPASAALLYSAILSNTVNFQANVTTDRDRAMAAWLKTLFDEPENYLHDMFVAKSTFDSLKEAIEHDFASIVIGDKKIGAAQLEIVDVAGVVANQRDELEKILQDLKDEYNLDYIFFTGIDVEKATNTFVVIDEQSQELLEKALEISFTKKVSVRPGIMMRKTITPKLKAYLTS